MKQSNPTQPNKWMKTPKKWRDLSHFERRCFEICTDLRRNKQGGVFLSTRGRAYYTPKPRSAGNFTDVYKQPKRPAIKKPSMVWRYIIFFVKLLLLSVFVSTVAGVTVGYVRSKVQTEYISPLPEGSTLQTPIMKTSSL